MMHHNNWQREKEVLSLLYCLLCYVILWHVAKGVVGGPPATERTAALQTTAKKKAEAGQDNAKSSSPTEGLASVVWTWRIWWRREERSLRNMPVWVCLFTGDFELLPLCVPLQYNCHVCSDYLQRSQIRKENFGLRSRPVVIMVGEMNLSHDVNIETRSKNNLQLIDHDKMTIVKVAE